MLVFAVYLCKLYNEYKFWEGFLDLRVSGDPIQVFCILIRIRKLFKFTI